MNERNNETPSAAPVQAAPGATTKVQKVRSSRYEWEHKPNENEKAAAASKASIGSLMASIGAWLKKFFSAGRGFFDNDDDASPSAA
jgi:hypothetical protein